jgi:hypothetical protein
MIAIARHLKCAYSCTRNGDVDDDTAHLRISRLKRRRPMRFPPTAKNGIAPGHASQRANIAVVHSGNLL